MPWWPPPRRGVDVKLVLPGVSDHSLIRYAGQAFYEPLLAGGVRIFELQIAVLHAKTAVIDGAWSTIGSANIDRRSFIHNYELNVVVSIRRSGATWKALSMRTCGIRRK
jgi:cardiolipin synthase